ncbi:MAG: siderophore-interacting protein [Jatrophihabitans sp.]|uniref:siderophore-interacting protein n=1 Tax=Jatrophihabitans sp. TaxID=1932789 RepID=UPI003F7D027D
MTAPLVRRSPVHRGEVVGATELTPRFRRVTVRAESLRGLVVRPTQDVELHLREASGRRVKRRYTIRHARPDVGELDLDVFLHGEHPGSGWGATASAGDAVEFQGPRGKLELRPSPLHLMVGDESALPAFAVIAESIGAGERAVAVIEMADASDEQPLAAEVVWVHRGAAEAGTPDRLLAALADDPLASLPLGDGVAAYLLGETRSMVALRAHLEGRGVPHDAIFVKGYWNLARPDRVAGRSPG